MISIIDKPQIEFDNVNEIYAIGDIHGDIIALRTILINLEVLNEELKWIKKNCIVVQVGDILDGKCRNEQFNDTELGFDLDMLAETRILQEKAKKENSKYISLIGNHELMNVLGMFDYVSDFSLKMTGGEIGRRNIFERGGRICQQLARFHPVVIRINNLLFCHGGVTHITNNFSLKYMNDLMIDFLTGNNFNQDLFYKIFIDNDDSILFSRNLVNGKYAEKVLSNVKKMYNADYVVVGHTVQDEINMKSNVIFIDTGISRSLSQKLNALVIKYDSSRKPVMTVVEIEH